MTWKRKKKAPGQWRVVKMAMLAKNAEIERPIGWCNVIYKAWLQVRFTLITKWLKRYEKQAPWDAAKPGQTCLSVAIHRVFQGELARANAQRRITVFLDLTTFYETIARDRLEQSAIELQFPATLLNIALQIYRGARPLRSLGFNITRDLPSHITYTNLKAPILTLIEP